MTDYEILAEKIFPNVLETIDDLEKRFPKRDLKDGAMVTRFAPSPTGFLHTGSLFTSLVSYRFAKQSNGVFYIRLEDTDTKREVSGSGAELLEQLKVFGITPDEGYLSDELEIGKYGPYKQSNRADIYKVVIKDLIKRGRAYPCFATQEELQEMRAKQEANKEIPGYYGKYAIYRNKPLNEQLALIDSGKPYIIRFRSMGNHENKIKIHDEIRGDLELTENDQDIVILKSDGLPTYHFAHLVDDHFMRTTHITRGEEWLSSLPIHLELFASMGWEAPKYAHLPVIMKLDNGNRRKLSKRKDNEAAVSYFLEQGYPKYGFIEYLLTLANSNYEMWREQNMDKDKYDFVLSFDKMSLDGALFDFKKVQNISKELMARRTTDEIVSEALEWSSKYSKELYDLICSDKEYFKKIMSIERNKDKPRKDYEKYSDILPIINFFYDKYYNELIKHLEWNEAISKDDIKALLVDYRDNMNLDLDEEAWFNDIKALGMRHNFCDSVKVWKKNKEAYKGHVGDVSEILRIAITGKKQSPNLYYVLKILGKERSIARINQILELI